MEVNVRYKSAAGKRTTTPLFSALHSRCLQNSVKSISILKGAENDREASEITCAWAMVDLPNTQKGVDEMVSMSSSELPLLVGSMEHPVDVNSAHIPSGMIS